MPTPYAGNVIQMLAQHLGVPAREIALSHDLYRDWGLTPLMLVVILLDLERGVAVELPSEELSGVRTVADLVRKFRGWVQADEGIPVSHVSGHARRSNSARNERRLRRELHHLRWLEENARRRPIHLARPTEMRRTGMARRRARQ